MTRTGKVSPVADNRTIIELPGTPVNMKTPFCHANPRSIRGRRLQLLKMVAIPLFPAVLLLVLSGLNLLNATKVKHRLTQTKHNIHLGHDIAGVIHQLQQERIEVALFTAQNRSATELFELFFATDQLIHELDLSNILGDDEDQEWQGSDITSKAAFVRKLSTGRYDEDIEVGIQVYSELNSIAISWLIWTVQSNDDDSFWEQIIAYTLLVRAKENFGISVPLGFEYLVLEYPPIHAYIDYIKNVELFVDHLENSFQYSNHLQDSYNESRQSNLQLFTVFENVRDSILVKEAVYTNGSAEFVWARNAETIIDIFKDLEDDLEFHILDLVENDFLRASLAVNVNVLIMLSVVVLIPLITFISRKVMKSIQDFAQSLEEKTQELDEEKKRSDSLLYRMLPRTVANQLKIEHAVRAEAYEAVTIYFSDIVGFTVLSSESSPMEIISLLNGLYNLFDSRIEVYDVYKVETIGDAYMVASGLPRRNGDSHAGEIATLTLDLIERMRYFTVPHRPDIKLQLRFGIHTGPCAAGVVGSKMPRYCLFGDTVNIASRMESHSLPMKIHISLQCKEILDKTGNYRITSRGNVDIKGKGFMNTFWLEERLDRKLSVVNRGSLQLSEYSPR